jgi:predicted transcriptional regulator
MKISDVIDALGLKIMAGGDLGRLISGFYISDMLSDVLANSKEGNLLITKQTHPNVVYVAVVKELPGIIIPGGKNIDAETIEKAVAEQIVILSTHLGTFEIAGELYTYFQKQGAGSEHL